jgi:hypothetical protein
MQKYVYEYMVDYKKKNVYASKFQHMQIHGYESKSLRKFRCTLIHVFEYNPLCKQKYEFLRKSLRKLKHGHEYMLMHEYVRRFL